MEDKIIIKKNPNGDTRTAKGDITFEDFQKAVLAGEPFDISLVADINKDKRQEEDKTQEATKDAPRRLAKIPFFRKKKNK